LRVELHAEGWVVTVAQAHHHVAVCPGTDLQLIRHSARIHNQRVITRRLERVGQTLEGLMPVVMNLGGLAVHRPVPYHRAAECLGESLMAEADAGHRHESAQLSNRGY